MPDHRPIDQPARADSSPVAAPGIPASATASARRDNDRARFGLLAMSHSAIDLFPVSLTALIPVLTERLALTSGEVTAVYILTPIFAGGCQPLFARLTDKHDTQLCGPLGVAICAMAVASIGFAQSFWQLVALQIIGVVAAGMYHPVTTATAGALGPRFLRNGRAQAIGLFISAGMIGQTLGPIVSSQVTLRFGIEHLAWLIAPSFALAIALHVVVRRVPHRRSREDADHHTIDAEDSRRRWRWIVLLAAQNGLRFIANAGMFVLFNTWAMSQVLRDEQSLALAQTTADPDETLAKLGSSYSASLMAAMTAGMGVSVLSLGRLVQRGRERGPLIYCTLIGAAALAVIGHVGNACVDALGLGMWALAPAYLVVLISPIGYFGTFPIVVSLAQRLQPDHTSFVTSLNMGVGWAISASAPLLASVFLGGVALDLAPTLSAERINWAFYGFAGVLTLAAVLVALIPKDAFAAAAGSD